MNLKLFRHKISAFAIAIVAIAAMTSCGGDSKDEPEASAPRSVLVYMLADNSLGGRNYDYADLNEMVEGAREGALGQSRLLVYHAPRGENPSLKEVTANGINVIKTYDRETSSASSGRMSQAIADFKSHAPADNYGLILWSHGSGWLQNGMEPPTASAKSFGDDRGYAMNVTTLATVLDGENFDYVYFDCCYMGGVEVAYELRGVTDHIIASAIELPANGMPYDQNLRYLTARQPKLREAAATTFAYYDSQSGEDRTCAISLIDTSALDDLASATREVYESSNGLIDGFRPQPFMVGSCYLFDFAHYAESMKADQSKLDRFDTALKRAVVYHASTPSIWEMVDIKHHCGLSTFILDEADDATYRNYNQLSWYGDVASHIKFLNSH